jgi:putative transposase
LDKAMKAFFRRVKAGQTPGFPRFKSRDRYDSFTYPDGAGWKLTVEKQQNKLKGMLHLTKIGAVKVNLHRELQGQVKTCTIKREGSHWYVIFAVEVGLTPRLAYSDELVGVDLGVLRLATLSTGDTIENPRHYRRAEHKLSRKQQALKHKKPRSKRRKKAARHVGKVHRKVANQRKDFLHKQSRALVDTYDTVVFEDLSPSNLSRRPKPKQDEDGNYLPNGAAAKGGLNKSIHDAGWGQFQQYCIYKAEEAGRYVLLVDPKYTSQVCSGCGAIRKKELSERWHSCECGTELDRDHNAAINIASLGRKLQGTRP